MRAFTLLELVIVLAIVSLLLSLVFPQIYKSSLSGEESFKNRFESLVSDAFSFNGGSELCVDFKKGLFSVVGQEIKLPYRAESIVLPGRLVSGELSSKYCFVPSRATVFVLNLKKEGGYLSIMVLFPMGETKFYSLKESEEETLKDKVEKGRVGEWFSYYWY
jgi:prepilin-type N-terminal cleavage/methylation domain-containing protein